MNNSLVLNLRKSFGKILKSNSAFQSCYNRFFLIKNKKSFLSMIQARSKLSIFEVEELIKPLPFCPFEKIKDSNYYGYVYSIKKFINQTDAKINIEHGLYLDKEVSYFSDYKTFDTICTLSDYRVQVLKEHNVKKRLLAIGPYIHYAEGLLSEVQLKKIKEPMGKVLLYMPSHSTNFDNGTSPFFREEVDHVSTFQAKHGFDTVIVCLYYRDFQYRDCVEYYKSKGFLLTTAGHQLDLNFVSRLKSIIELADYTMSNQIGTNTGFCVYLHKPHIIINDYDGKYNKSRSGYYARREIADAFLSFHESITEEQIRVVNKYWGGDEIKTKEELLDFLNNK